jgi:alpha-L-rhamnosidase
MENNHRDWRALWITQSWQRDAHPLLGRRLAFRRDYTVDSPPIAATIAITASVQYFLWINGSFIANGPSRSYPGHQIYDTIDISSNLVTGTNRFAILVQKPSGITGYSLIHRMGLFLDAVVVCNDTQIPIRSDATWKVRNADWYIETPYICSIPVGFQEHVDGAKEPPVEYHCLGSPALPVEPIHV